MVVLELSTRGDGKHSDALVLVYALMSRTGEIFTDLEHMDVEEKAHNYPSVIRELKSLIVIYSDLANRMAEELANRQAMTGF